MTNPVTISEKALNEISKMMKTKNVPEGYGLRIGIKGGGGCGSAMAFMLGFDKPKDDDLTYQVGEVSVYMEKKHTMYLIGLEVDFYDEADARGFTFVKTD